MSRTLVVGLLLIASTSVACDKASKTCSTVLTKGQLPAPVPQPEASSSKYHFVTTYTMLGPQGAELGSHVLTAEFVANQKEVRWLTVTVGKSLTRDQVPSTVEHKQYVEGFSYTRDASKITSADFFGSFPANANDEKNLIWDELMFHSFVDNVDRLRLNEPVLAQSGDVMLGGSGTFTNRKIEMTLVGVGRRNGEECALIHYEALLNHFVLTPGIVKVEGRSDYFGDIWISLRTRQIEYATLSEEVAGVVANVPNAPGPQPLHVLRTATLQRVP